MEYGDYQGFIIGNRIRINQWLNRILWLFALAGPAIALGVRQNVFPYISYTTCAAISLFVIVLSGFHLILVKRLPKAMITSVFALAALDILIVYMALSHVNIHLTWFLVPLLSILFCDRRLYCGTLVLNYLLMAVTVWLTAPFQAALRADYVSAPAYFLDVMGGFTIETFCLACSGFIIVVLAADNFKELFEKNEKLREKEASEQEKIGILDSMAEIYDNVNLISFTENTEMSLRDAEHTRHGIDMSSQTHTLMNQRIRNHVLGDQLDSFLTFTNITTVRDRMEKKKIISADFIDINQGWFRAQYITVEKGSDSKPDIVIYTTRNVDEEKRREEHLIHLTMTDELTRLNNRRAFEEDIAGYRRTGMNDDFVIFSIDVNGLKQVNDNKGHSAGDELIKGAARCLASAIGNSGKIYRTGGDEFMAIVHTDHPEQIAAEIQRYAQEWRGEYDDELSMSTGFASHRTHPEASPDELEQIADTEMYAEKERYYKEKGIDRRRK